MKSYAILYSATSALDYRFIAWPDEGFVPKSVCSEFKKHIKGVLWGTACQNAVFSEDYINDKKSRSIQCFIGIVVEFPDERLKLPFDTQAFSPLFKEIMNKVWESRDAASIHLPVLLQDFASIKFVHRKEGNALNYDSSNCKLFPSTYPYVENLFAEALSAQKEISFAAGIVSRDEVTSPEYSPLLNAILTKGFDVIKDIPVLRYCSKCRKPYYSLKDGLCNECIKEINKLERKIEPTESLKFSFSRQKYVEEVKNFKKIYLYAVSRSIAEKVIERLDLNAEITRNIDDADIVIAHKNFVKGGAKVLSTAEHDRLQIFYVKTNSMAQIQKIIKQALDIAEMNEKQSYYDITEKALDEAKAAGSASTYLDSGILTSTSSEVFNTRKNQTVGKYVLYTAKVTHTYTDSSYNTHTYTDTLSKIVYLRSETATPTVYSVN